MKICVFSFLPHCLLFHLKMRPKRGKTSKKMWKKNQFQHAQHPFASQTTQHLSPLAGFIVWFKTLFLLHYETRKPKLFFTSKKWATSVYQSCCVLNQIKAVKLLFSTFSLFSHLKELFVKFSVPTIQNLFSSECQCI